MILFWIWLVGILVIGSIVAYLSGRGRIDSYDIPVVPIVLWPFVAIFAVPLGALYFLFNYFYTLGNKELTKQYEKNKRKRDEEVSS